MLQAKLDRSVHRYQRVERLRVMKLHDIRDIWPTPWYMQL